MKKLSILLSTFALLVSTVALGSVKDKKRWKAANEQVLEVKKAADSACGARFSFTYSKKTFTPADFDMKNMGGFCGDVFVAIKDLCADADYKPEVVKQIKKVTCTYKKGLKKPELKLKKGKLEFMFNWDTANHESVAKTFIENNL